MNEPRVWVVESGDYAQRGIDLVGGSLEAAVKAIKARYCSPYVVEWGELKDEGEYGHSLTGKFAGVRGHCIEHTDTFDITAWDVAR